MKSSSTSRTVSLASRRVSPSSEPVIGAAGGTDDEVGAVEESKEGVALIVHVPGPVGEEFTGFYFPLAAAAVESPEEGDEGESARCCWW